MNTLLKKIMTTAAVLGMSVMATGVASACVMTPGPAGWYCRPVPVQVCRQVWVQTGPFLGQGYWTPVCRWVYR